MAAAWTRTAGGSAVGLAERPWREGDQAVGRADELQVPLALHDSLSVLDFDEIMRRHALTPFEWLQRDTEPTWSRTHIGDWASCMGDERA